jgi:hypothetical protein
MRTPKVNDILASSWGHEQTNVDFYKVIKVTDKSIRIEQVATAEEDKGYLTGEATAVPDSVVGEAMTKRFYLVGDDRYGCRIASYASAYLWDGKPKYCSHGH